MLRALEVAPSRSLFCRHLDIEILLSPLSDPSKCLLLNGEDLKYSGQISHPKNQSSVMQKWARGLVKPINGVNRNPPSMAGYPLVK